MQINLIRKVVAGLLLLFITLSSLFVSCTDDYLYVDEEPDFLGESIYKFLEDDGNFKYFTRLIEDLDYKEVLSRTGSKTLFVARDDAFEDFFNGGNVYGVRSYEELTIAQKRSIMNVSMLNMAYLSYMLSNTASSSGNMGEGQALRHYTALSYMDSISYIRDEVLFKNPYWERFSNNGLYLVDNEDDPPMVHFTPEHKAYQGITDEDFQMIMDIPYEDNSIYINGVKVIEPDVICKNGYVHIMESLLLPTQNMSQIIRDNGETNTFNDLMNKFCAPYYVSSVSNNVHVFYDGSTPDRPLIPLSDSVFVKRYFTDTYDVDPANKNMESYGLLYYDPSVNNYAPDSYQSDMGVMLVPSDRAMDEYINGDRGRYLKDAYGGWDNIPTSLLALFIKNHQLKSFMSSLPHSWPELTDESSFDLKLNAERDFYKSYLGCNGVVYVMNNVYPPVDYQCVYASTLINDNTQIMNWAIQDNTMKFKLYLRSMENMYNLIVPTDEAFQNYRDPVAWGKGINYREIWSFYYDPVPNMVYADVYSVDDNGEKLDKIREVTDGDIIRNRLTDILDMHIVVGEKEGDEMWGYIDEGNTQYAMTKGGAVLKIEGQGDDVLITGGGDLEMEIQPAEVVANNQGLKSRYDSDNGRTFFVDKILHDPVKSVYTVLGEHPEYEAFFNLLRGNDEVFSHPLISENEEIQEIFGLNQLSNSSGMGFVVNSFNNFRYTVFVPTEEALQRAFQENEKLFDWDEIVTLRDEEPELMLERTLYLLNFLKYHFMDNSIYISGESFNDMIYETAARNEVNRFRRLTLSSNGNNLVIQCEKNSGNGYYTAEVEKKAGLYNLMARDYIVDSRFYQSAENIIASSRSVIHLVNEALRFE